MRAGFVASQRRRSAALLCRQLLRTESPLLPPSSGVRDLQLGQVALADAPAVVAVDEVRDAVEQAAAGFRGQREVAGVGAQHVQVRGRGVRQLPLVAAEDRRAEPARAY